MAWDEVVWNGAGWREVGLGRRAVAWYDVLGDGVTWGGVMWCGVGWDDARWRGMPSNGVRFIRMRAGVIDSDGMVSCSV